MSAAPAGRDAGGRGDVGGLVAHGEVLRGLWRAAAAGRLPHALLFAGPRGIGRFRAAELLARGLLCERGPDAPCEACGACTRTRTGNHLDLFVLDPLAEGRESLQVHRFAYRPAEKRPPEDRDRPCAEEFFALRAAERGWRVAIVREMERARPEAQNAMLKMLEEPAPGCLWILECSRLEALLPTIHSRCIRVDFPPLGADDAARVLASSGVPAEEAARLARWSRGSPGVALELRERGGAALRELVAAALAGRGGLDGAVERARDVWDVEGSFPPGTPTAQARERARTTLGLLLAVAGDGLRWAAGVAPDELAHGDLFAPGGALAGLPRVEARWRGALHTALVAREDVEHNLAPDAALDRAFAALPGVGAAAEVPAR